VPTSEKKGVIVKRAVGQTQYVSMSAQKDFCLANSLENNNPFDLMYSPNLSQQQHRRFTPLNQFVHFPPGKHFGQY
jgi:hypothetical protein